MSDQFPKVYLAAPFFNPQQVALVEQLEQAINRSGWRMFSPRLGANAQEMNDKIGALKHWKRLSDAVALLEAERFQVSYPGIKKPEPPSTELRHKVFFDNFSNIDDADLLLAVIDDFDVGVMWEVGYAFARHVPIVTTTGRDYGCNLMLAHSIVGHTKSVAQVQDVLAIGSPGLSFEKKMDEYGAAIAEIQQKYKSDFALKEGPDEREQ